MSYPQSAGGRFSRGRDKVSWFHPGRRRSAITISISFSSAFSCLQMPTCAQDPRRAVLSGPARGAAADRRVVRGSCYQILCLWAASPAPLAARRKTVLVQWGSAPPAAGRRATSPPVWSRSASSCAPAPTRHRHRRVYYCTVGLRVSPGAARVRATMS